MFRLIILLALISLICASAQARTRVYRSPDGVGTAIVTAQPVSDEGVVTLYRRGRPRACRSFVSDGNHGQIVERAAWTPDSRFFVFTTSSSGGHSPWHHWTFAWSRRDNKIHSLDDAYSSTMTEAFQLKAPDFLTTCFQNEDGRALTVRLSRVHWKPGIGASR